MEAPPCERLVEMAEAVDPNLLLLFSQRLIKGARRRRFKANRAALNRAYLDLARMSIDRALAIGNGRASA